MSDNSNSGISMQQFYQGGIRIAQNVCAVVTTPVEYALRPFYGTRYFDPIQMAMTCVLMMLLPLLGRLTSYLPVVGGASSTGGFVGLGTISLLFFASNVIHGPRLWRRIFNMELEQHSEFEGPALPFFTRLPLGESFWVVRVVWEPLFVALVAVVLSLIPVFTRPAMIYLLVCAFMLAFKNYLSWYQSWLHLRSLMDAKFAGPLVAKAVSGKATEKELSQVHLAGFLGSVPAEIRAAAIAEMAPRTTTLPPEIAQLISAVEPIPSRAA